ncbi:MAG: pyridoxal-phosphate dependent enzyme [Chloroflexi bacterium]|nr:pyridoxal-phosphate dependent enzyme [Chloroflexota bacterium]
MDLPTLDDVRQARQGLRGVIVPTPLQTSATFSARAACEVLLKPECLQKAGAFKLRGAYTKIHSLTPEQRGRGVITYSSGNHAQGVAYAARLMGARAVVVMPENAIPAKVAATRGYGAEVVFAGLDSLARQHKAEELVREHGYTMVPPFDDPHIIAGQGTVGLEILDERPDVATIVAPIGGGGLCSGVALAAKEAKPSVRVVGVEPEVCPDARDSLRAGEICTAASIDTIADGLRVRRVGERNFALMRRYVDDIVTVTEDEIRQAVVLLAERAKLVVEPSGAVTLAALLAGRVPTAGPVCAILSGGNIDRELLARLLLEVPVA